MSTEVKPRELSWGKRLAYAAGNFGVGLMPAMIGSWAMYYYAPPAEEGPTCLKTYVPIYLIGAMLAIGRVAEALINPFIGDWSDKTNSRWGRRIPYILFGAPVLAIGLCLLWFPPVPHESLVNAAWVCFWMTIVSCAFAVVVAPYLSLLPELTPHNHERITLSALMAVFEVLGTLAAVAGSAIIIDRYKCGVFYSGVGDFTINLQAGFAGYVPQYSGGFNGFMLAGILFASVGLLAFYVTGLGVKEKPYSAAKAVTLPFMTGVKEVFRNPGFSPYLAFMTAIRIGMDTVVVVIPYIVTTVMGGSEADAGLVQLVVLAGAILLFPIVEKLSVRYGKKRVTLWGCAAFVIILPFILLIGKVPGVTPMMHGYLIFGLATFPVAVFSVLPRPLLADIIDLDEKTTGFRREAMFNGMEGLFTRSASGLAWVVSSLLFFAFGNSADNPLGILLTGPVGSAVVLVGALWFMKYPLKD